MKDDIYLGALVEGRGYFKLGTHISIDSQTKTWRWAGTSFLPVGKSIRPGDIGIVVADPNVNQFQFGEDDCILYVVFPEAIGWSTTTYLKKNHDATEL